MPKRGSGGKRGRGEGKPRPCNPKKSLGRSRRPKPPDLVREKRGRKLPHVVEPKRLGFHWDGRRWSGTVRVLVKAGRRPRAAGELHLRFALEGGGFVDKHSLLVNGQRPDIGAARVKTLNSALRNAKMQGKSPVILLSSEMLEAMHRKKK